MTKNRWTRKEVRLAKDALIEMKGNKTQAAAIVSQLTGRTHAAVMVRMCEITKTYPSLRKKSIAKKEAKMMKVNTPEKTVEPTIQSLKGTIEFHKDHIRIYF